MHHLSYLCLWWEEVYFCNNAQTTLTWSVITLVHWRSISGHLSEVKLNNYDTRPTSNQLKACSDSLSCIRSRTSGSSLIFPNLSLVGEIVLQAESLNYCTSFQIQLSISHFHPQALSYLFRNFHWKSARLRRLQCCRIPFRSLFSKQTKRWILKGSTFPRRPLETESLAWVLSAFVSLANQIIWTILTRIVIGLF